MTVVSAVIATRLYARARDGNDVARSSFITITEAKRRGPCSAIEPWKLVRLVSRGVPRPTNDGESVENMEEWEKPLSRVCSVNKLSFCEFDRKSRFRAGVAAASFCYSKRNLNVSRLREHLRYDFLVSS